MTRARAWLGIHLLLWATASSCTRPTAPVSSEAGTARASSSAILPGQPAGLTIFYTSDLHGRDSADETAETPGGLARRATLVDLARVSSRAVLQVDAGDFLPQAADDPGLTSRPALEHRVWRVLRAYQRMGVDVITPGERELAFGAERLTAWLKEAGLTAVASNLSNARGERMFAADHLLTRGGHSVGIFGIVELDEGLDAGAAKAPGWTIDDAAAAAASAVRSLKARGAETIVGLFHTPGGRARAQAILGPDSGVDAVVLAHVPDGTAPTTRVGQTDWLSTGARGGDLVGRLELWWAAPGERPLRASQVLPLGRTLREHPGVALLVQSDRESVRRDHDAYVRTKKANQGSVPTTVSERWEYSSTAGCAFCHRDEVAQWKTTAHAHALATLEQDGHGAEPECLGCHLTGYLRPGGSQVLAIATDQFANVGCESCHGPGVLHVRSNNKKSTISRLVPTTVCLGCHTSDRAAFDPDEARKQVLGPGHGAP